MYVQKEVFDLNELVTMVNSITYEDKNKLKRLTSFVEEAFQMSLQEKSSDLAIPYQGEIWTCKLGTNVGSEIEKTRPCLILQKDDMNIASSTTLIVPVTHKTNIRETHVEINKTILKEYNNNNGNEQLDGVFIIEQMRCISKARLGKKIGMLNEYGIRKVKKAFDTVISN